MTGMDSPVALVTGGARGIGAATVRALLAEGWAVGVADRTTAHPGVPYAMASPEDLAEVVADGGPRARGFAADASDPEAMAGAVAETVSAFGRLDAVVCAAGVVAGGRPAWEVDDEEWAAVLSTDLTGVFVTVRAAMPTLVSSPNGRVVMVASAAGALGLRHMAPYSAAKHGVIGFTRALAADLAGTTVTANAVSPGSTDTAALAESARIYGLTSVDDFVSHQTPLGRLINPSEVAATIAWLCSPASSALTGAVIAVDGGMTATP
jgi:SDR family mycofactocin-dependent oxidoreductase